MWFLTVQTIKMNLAQYWIWAGSLNIALVKAFHIRVGICLLLAKCSGASCISCVCLEC